MKDKKHVEFRYYDIPQGDIVLPLSGEVWNKEYGEGKEKLHFHNYYEVGHCYSGEGEMILGEKELHFYPGCISLIPTKELHTTNTFGKKAGWEWMYFDIHDVLKKLYPDDVIDLYGRMYPAFSEITDYLDNKPEKPLLLVEYCHSMGNSPGDFKEYLDLTEQYPALCGGFVWEWCDHAIFKGMAENGKAMYWYGGDHGELQHDGNFCLDGLVYPDRTPHTGLLEYKNVHRPLRASFDHDRKILTVENHTDFTDPAGSISAIWTLTLDGLRTDGGRLTDLPSIAPHGKGEIPLSFAIPDKGRCFLTVTYVLRKEWCSLPAGHELGFDEIRIPTAEARPAAAANILSASGTGARIKIREDGRFLLFEGENFIYKLDTFSGLFTSLKIRSRELLDRPADFNLWRAPTDNDAPLAEKWKQERLDHTVTRAYEIALPDSPDRNKDGTNIPVTVKIRQSVAAMSVQAILRISNTVAVFPDGRILFDIHAVKDPEIETLPRIGLRLFLSKNMDQVSYYGMGPGETYIDMHHSGRHGCYEGSAASMHEDYIRPQENGSHYDCDYVSVRGRDLSLTVACADKDTDRTFSFNISIFTQEELEQKRHNYELEPCGSTVLCIDHQMAGIGSKSCGPDLLPGYRVCAENYHFSFILKPEEL